MGDFIIEINNFNPREKNFFYQNITMNKIFNFDDYDIKKIKIKNKIIGIVDDNLYYKKLNENIKLSKQKIKISQFDFDFLDVKFIKGDFDFCITQIKEFKNKNDEKNYFEKLFYQLEFIIKKKFCFVSRYEFNLEKYFLKYKTVKFDKKIKIKILEQNYFIFIFKKI